MDIYDPLAWTILVAAISTIYAVAVTLILLKESAADAATIDYLISQLVEQSKTPDQGYEWTLHPSKARDILADELERTYNDRVTAVARENDALCSNQNALEYDPFR